MRGPRWAFLIGCFVVSVFGTSAVKAGGGGTIEGGTISFVGSLVEPTCNLSTAPDLLSPVASAAGMRQSYRRSCSGGTTEVPVNASRTYSASVVHLSSAESDQVLRYFASYVRAAQPRSADPVLVTQTYE
jgi:type 1 fimbria pilin